MLANNNSVSGELVLEVRIMEKQEHVSLVPLNHVMACEDQFTKGFLSSRVTKIGGLEVGKAQGYSMR